MDLDKLKTFIAIAELGSFTSAAGMVNLTQSAVSQQLKELESDLDIVLFDRSSRPVTLTNEGAKLIPVAKQMLQFWQSYKEDHEQKHFEGKLIIGYVSSIMTKVLAHALQSLRNKYPELAIKLINTGGVTKHLAQMVADNELDAAFGVGPTRVPKGVLWRPYSAERYFVISKHKGSVLTDEELLSSGPYLRFAPNLLVETMIDKAINKRGIKVDPIMELDSYSSILLLVSHDIGVGIVPESYLMSRDLGTIPSCIPFGVPPLTREMGIMVRHDSPNKKLVNILHMAMRHFSNKILSKQ